jgi:hypothetical protein
VLVLASGALAFGVRVDHLDRFARIPSVHVIRAAKVAEEGVDVAAHMRVMRQAIKVHHEVASYFDRLQAPTRCAPIEGSSFDAHLEISFSY